MKNRIIGFDSFQGLLHDEEKDAAGRVAERLMAPELFTGWGVRTLSSEHPAYNPCSYHRGSVWPVEQGTFALRFMRCGLWNSVDLITKAQFEAATLFDFCRLPEVFSGHPRDNDHPFPALYPKANWPQAWSSSAVFCFVQSMLALYPYAPLNLLLVDPHLAEWLPNHLNQSACRLSYCQHPIFSQTGRNKQLRSAGGKWQTPRCETAESVAVNSRFW